MATYRVSFFRVSKESNEKSGGLEKFGQEVLGTVTIDDVNTGPELTLEAKAFRHSSALCQTANKVKIEKINA